MTRTQIIRTAYSLAVTALIWRTLIVFTSGVWTLIVTLLSHVIFVSVLVYVYMKTQTPKRETPSAVRSRLREASAQLQARLPKE